MNKVAVYGQSYAISSKIEINTLVDILEKNSIEIYFEEEFYRLLKENNIIKNTYSRFSSFKDLDASFDIILTIGGDGTFLRSVNYIRNLDIPVLGINTGRLGFLAIVAKNFIEESLNKVLTGNYTIQERTLLSIEINPKTNEFPSFNFALNEVSITKKSTTSMIGVKTFLDGDYLTNYWADGLIISTPTGSTGYSLSCNGPIILPNSKNLVITPIASHNLNARPVVIPDYVKVEVEVDSREKSYLISLDSVAIDLPSNTKVFIEKAKFTLKNIIPKNNSFLKTLRSKLWGEDIRNKPNF